MNKNNLFEVKKIKGNIITLFGDKEYYDCSISIENAKKIPFDGINKVYLDGELLLNGEWDLAMKPGEMSIFTTDNGERYTEEEVAELNVAIYSLESVDFILVEAQQKTFKSIMKEYFKKIN